MDSGCVAVAESGRSKGRRLAGMEGGSSVARGPCCLLVTED